MLSGDVAGWRSTLHEHADAAVDFHPSHRGVSCGSVASLHEMPCSQLSARFSSRISCRSSVRDEEQTIDEFRRKQRVVRYMQEERERAARSRLEREEHDDWVGFRSLERAERIKYLNDKEISELLRREAEEVERERAEAEEAVRRGAEEAMGRRRALADARQKRMEREMLQAERSATGNAPLRSHAANEVVVKRDGVKNLAKEYEKNDDELQVRLRAAQEEASVMRVKLEDAKQAQRLAEEKLLFEAKRAEEEAALRKRAEKNVDILEGKLDGMRIELADMEERLRREREKNVDAGNMVAAKREELLSGLREQLQSAQKESKAMEARCRKLQTEKEGLMRKLKNSTTNQAKTTTTTTAAAETQRQTDHVPAFDDGHNVRIKKGSDDADVRRQLQQADADRKRLKEAEEALSSVQSRLERQTSVLDRTNAEMEVVKRKLLEETTARRKFEELAAKSIQIGTEGPTREELERAEKEARRCRDEAEAARTRLNALRESSDREIGSLKAWCARLEDQCARHEKELREQVAFDALYSPRTGCTMGANGCKGGDAAAKTVSNQEDTAMIARLQSEVHDLQAKLKESMTREKQSVALAQTLQQERLSRSSGVPQKCPEAEELEGVLQLFREPDVGAQKAESVKAENGRRPYVRDRATGGVAPPAGANGSSAEAGDRSRPGGTDCKGPQMDGRAHSDDIGKAAAVKHTQDDGRLKTHKAVEATSNGRKKPKTQTGCC